MWNVDGMVRKTREYLSIFMAAIFLFACDVEEPLTLGELVVDAVTSDAVYCHVNVGGAAPDDCGFYYATSADEVGKSGTQKVEGTYGLRAFSGVIEGLEPYTTYYIMAYAMNARGREYTNTIAVKTTYCLPESGDNAYPDVEL